MVTVGNTMTITQLQIKAEQLKGEIKGYKSSNESYKRKMKAAEKSYDSIYKFRQTLTASESAFSGINRKKSIVLESVDKVSKNSIVAKNYSIGMEKLLKGIGASITSKLFSFLLNKTQREKQDLEKKITDYTGKIDYNKKMIKNKQEELDITMAEIKRLNG